MKLQSRQIVLAESKAWLGVKFSHLGRSKTSGVDCLGLIEGIWTNLYSEFPFRNLVYNRPRSINPHKEVDADQLGNHLIELPKFSPNQISLIIFELSQFRFHLGIGVTNIQATHLIHTDFINGVVLEQLSSRWSKKIKTIYNFSEE